MAVAAGLATTRGLLRGFFHAALIPIVLAHLALPVGGQHLVGRIETRVVLAVGTRARCGGIRYAESSFRHFIFPLGKYLRLLGGLDEVDLQERLEVQVRHLILVANTEELGERGVREDAALERRVEARVRLDVLADELRHLRLRARLARLQTHEVAELIRQRALNQEGVVGTARLPRRLLLRRHRRRVTTLLLLRVARLTLGRLRRLLNGADSVTDLRAQLRTERLELLGERRELGLRRGGRRLNNRRCSDRRHRHLRLGGSGSLRRLGDLRRLRLSGGLRGLGGSGNRRRGGRGGSGLRGILLGDGHLV